MEGIGKWLRRFRVWRIRDRCWGRLLSWRMMKFMRWCSSWKGHVRKLGFWRMRIWNLGKLSLHSWGRSRKGIIRRVKNLLGRLGWALRKFNSIRKWSWRRGNKLMMKNWGLKFNSWRIKFEGNKDSSVKNFKISNWKSKDYNFQKKGPSKKRKSMRIESNKLWKILKVKGKNIFRLYRILINYSSRLNVQGNYKHWILNWNQQWTNWTNKSKNCNQHQRN